MVALTVGVFALATGYVVVGSAAMIVAAVSAAAGAGWLLHTHRKVRNAELRWEAMNSDEPAPRPTS